MKRGFLGARGPTGHLRFLGSVAPATMLACSFLTSAFLFLIRLRSLFFRPSWNFYGLRQYHFSK